ncbi:SDR family NAD(P)-dependent oxidoreductase [Tsuneonella sp. YG55]|uniref:SDR family NAD(P)-dependent oxidoreductase n=1 Tax=Tsuneonella litorea TaxID=2976475 RepID=A0A9X3AL71_9SPHN|nr:SDR family NAD(P)-dependent oxidoreductase [Tsuneonella litorea]MCT2559339.1 SDR family NAD(P)-dependent oxidoreductase [Tsuneonella litorea]
MSGLRAAVWGASGGIGQALVDALVSSGEYASIHAGSRAPAPRRSPIVRPFAFDLLDEESIAASARAISHEGAVDLVIVATGMLHTGRHRPEKQFAALGTEAMMAAFRVNAIGPALIAKHMVGAFPRDRRSVFAALSARVGSIGDNRLGGWHSYRASKAALNMIIANLAIELARTHPQAIAVGLHPGTVDTALSLPFRKSIPPGSLFSPATSARHLLSVVAGLEERDSGAVWAWDGQRIVP